MAQFITRVELHDYATGDEYETLHTAMQKEGFIRNILATDGKYYHMLTAEYNMNANIPAEDVRALAVKAAKTTGKRHSVFVSEIQRCVWIGLTEVIK